MLIDSAAIGVLYLSRMKVEGPVQRLQDEHDGPAYRADGRHARTAARRRLSDRGCLIGRRQRWGRTPGTPPPLDRAAVIRDLHDRGATQQEIADNLGLSREYTRDLLDYGETMLRLGAMAPNPAASYIEAAAEEVAEERGVERCCLSLSLAR